MKTVNFKDTFDNVVTIYDAARPLYPEQLLKDVQEFSGTTRYDRALEVGAGTGQATDIYDADRYALLLESYSSTQTLDDDSRKMYLDEVRAYINENGGIVEMPQHVMLYLVKKSST